MSGDFWLRLAVLLCELLIRHAEVHDELDEGDHRWDKSPAEDQVEETLQGFAKVELVNTKATEEEGQQSSSDPALA